jgi:hydroxymethylpyrimidine pyrophosphatase-like HAD family hydrolase
MEASDSSRSAPSPPAIFFEGREEMGGRLAEAIREGARAQLESKRFALILTDIEGCLNFDPLTYDHELLGQLRYVNEAASWTNALPFITLCTGRQAPFVDAFSAFLSVRLPVIFEGGCGLFFPTAPPGTRHAWHPRLADGADGEYRRLESAVTEVAEVIGANPSLGKGRLLTFHPKANRDVDTLLAKFTQSLSEKHIEAEVTRSANAVDIAPSGISKGTAVHWLLEVVREQEGPALEAHQVIGIGDAPNDLSFLEVVGRSVAPANAEDELKRQVDVVSRYSDAKAVAEAVVVAVEQNLAQG